MNDSVIKHRLMAKINHWVWGEGGRAGGRAREGGRGGMGERGRGWKITNDFNQSLNIRWLHESKHSVNVITEIILAEKHLRITRERERMIQK